MGEPEIMTDYIYDATSEAALNISVSAASTATSAVTVSASADVMRPYLMPQAEYMYGCTATSIGMLLGYYDLYGYLSCKSGHRLCPSGIHCLLGLEGPAEKPLQKKRFFQKSRKQKEILNSTKGCPMNHMSGYPRF